jgi:acetoin:2,6-dichlorophenolindophenol oxidoreductase subunit alpha
MRKPRLPRRASRVAAVDFDPVAAYRMMLRMRLVEESIVRAWRDGLVPGEYHSGIGEEGINAGVVLHLSGADTVAADHRNTAPFLGRGADPRSLLLEVLGSEQGMNRGWAGHMHLLDPDLHVAADGIVGASAPLAVGNAIAHARLRPGRVAVSLHGEAAMNQGMLMEAYNLAVAWRLPVVFVCRDNRWSITTHSADVTGGSLVRRASSFGLAVESVDGAHVEQVHAAAGRLIGRARAGGGPGFLHATCHRPGGHFEGDPLLRLLHDPLGQAAELGPGIVSGTRSSTGGSAGERARALGNLARRGGQAAREWAAVPPASDPLRLGRALLDGTTAGRVETEERSTVGAAVAAARAAIGPRPTFGVGGGSR